MSSFHGWRVECRLSTEDLSKVWCSQKTSSRSPVHRRSVKVLMSIEDVSKAYVQRPVEDPLHGRALKCLPFTRNFSKFCCPQETTRRTVVHRKTLEVLISTRDLSMVLLSKDALRKFSNHRSPVKIILVTKDLSKVFWPMTNGRTSGHSRPVGHPLGGDLSKACCPQETFRRSAIYKRLIESLLSTGGLSKVVEPLPKVF